jgi:hypothetical protein
MLLAQSSLEFAGGTGPTSSGSTTSSQVVTFQSNGNNPSGNTFTGFSPTTTVTYSISSQQYALKPTQSTNNGTLSFGANNNNSGSMLVSEPTYTSMNFISSPTNGILSSLPSTIGKGIDVTANYGVEFFTSCMGLANNNLSTSGRYYMANVTLTFNQPVTNPVLQLVGIGGYYDNLGFTSELQLVTSGVTLSKLSGSPELNVTATSILNSASSPSSVTGSGAASGSILVSGSGITQLVFQVYMRGDGGESKWGASSGEHSGDVWLLGVSMETSMYVLPLNINGFTATAQGNSAVLQWSDATQTNTDHFEIQYSQNGSTWENIGVVNVAGNPTTASDYSYVQYSPATGAAYYRIAQVNSDGSSSYTAIQHLNFGQLSGGVTCYPNPARDRVTIASAVDNFKSMQLLSIDGRVLQVTTGFRSGESIDLSGYPAGVYLVVVHHSDGTSQTTKVQKI